MPAMGLARQCRGDNGMPTYEYLCQDCSHRFEVWQKMTDEPLSICSECGGHIRRVYYPAGIVFKGSGFYKTDHPAASNGHDHAKKDAGESKAAAEKVSSESKPAESSTSSAAAASSSNTSENKASTG